jgi:hypothetical protein
VKGGRGLKHHETLIVFSVRGVAAKIVNSRKPKKSAGAISFFGNALRRLVTG